MQRDLTPLLIVTAFFLIVLVLLYVVHRLRISQLKSQIDGLAMEKFETWRSGDFEAVVRQQTGIANREAVTKLNEWKVDYEASIRKDAIERSRAVIVGQVTEHLIPHMPVFPYNPKDARFIGSPIDLIVFDGSHENDVREVIFLEIKTGSSSLSQRQRQIRDAVTTGRVSWRVLNL